MTKPKAKARHDISDCFLCDAELDYSNRAETMKHFNRHERDWAKKLAKAERLYADVRPFLYVEEKREDLARRCTDCGGLLVGILVVDALPLRFACAHCVHERMLKAEAILVEIAGDSLDKTDSPGELNCKLRDPAYAARFAVAGLRLRMEEAEADAAARRAVTKELRRRGKATP